MNDVESPQAQRIDGLAVTGPDGRWVVTRAGLIQVWDGATGALLHTMPAWYQTSLRPLVAAAGWVAGVREGPATESDRGGQFYVDLWNVATGQLSGGVAHPSYPIDHDFKHLQPDEPSIAVDPAGRYLFTASRTGQVVRWDLAAGTNQVVSPVRHGTVEVEVDPTGEFYAVVNTNNAEFQVRTVADDQLARPPLTFPDEYFNRFQLGAGAHWAVGIRDDVDADDYTFYDLDAGRPTYATEDAERTECRYCDEYHHDEPAGLPLLVGDFVVMGHRYCALQVRRVRTGGLARSLTTDRDGAVMGAVLAADPASELVAAVGDQLTIWNVSSGRNVRNFPTDQESDVDREYDWGQVAFAAGGRWVVRALGRRFWVWDLVTGDPVCGPISVG